MQTRAGWVVSVGINSGAAQRIRIRNPWPGDPVEVTAGDAGVSSVSHGPIIEFQAIAGTSYDLVNHRHPQPMAQIGGTPASAPRKLGPAQIGLFAPASSPEGTKLKE